MKTSFNVMDILLRISDDVGTQKERKINFPTGQMKVNKILVDK